ncbi:MAG: glycosyltransferase [Alistipes sp.]|jgi:glycosyltransferase involved in cell wall biosynthesis|nr:glycosyltransferase [Alistipes sp.]
MEIKIAFSHEEYPAAGTEKVTEILAAYLAERGYKIYVFVEKLRPELLSESDKRNIEFIPTEFGKKDTPQMIADEIEKLGIDIFVNPFGWQIDMTKLRSLTRTKIVFTNHMQGLQEIDDFFISRRLGARKALRRGNVWRFFRWFFLREPYEYISGDKKRRMTRWHKAYYRNSDLYTVLCDSYKQTVLKKVAKRGEDHVEVIENWIPPRTFAPGPKKNVVLYVGRLNSYQKRLDRLVDIWARLEKRFPDWEMWIVGKGEERENLIRQTERLGLKNVKFRDFTTDPGEYYSQASILALTSSNEAWGLVISEAQQAGVIPIAFDVSEGVRVQLAPDGVNGVLVKPFNKRKYACRLAELMGDPALREEMSRNVVAKAREYSNAGRLAKWDIAFKKLLNRP